ncbi:hypothetical protein [Shewanella sp. NIFS-20-20]|nr:hypothetical protein [Shewanella sp. NIFS-20-20]MBV7314960.1 hypothetical protein [Shewanella sp. NIFS-20-20]
MNTINNEKIEIIEDTLLDNISGGREDAFCFELCWEFCLSICFEAQ